MDLLQGVIGDDTRVFFADALVPELGAALRVTFVAAGDAAEAQSARWQRIG
ncbi:MAG TPA: hypothetical protein VMM79_12715 [Longimicrobiales bacterium]|nr:hypothetical protein [Longimicrobiales bacterium]